MPGKKRIGFAELRVGLLVLLSIGILIAMILTISGDISPFKNFLYVRTKLSEVDGLRQGTEVRLAGVHIGSVTQVNLLPILKSAQDKPNFKITVQSLDGLKTGGVPDEVLKKLETLKDQKISGEAEFEDTLKQTIGDEPTDKFKALIVKQAQEAPKKRNVEVVMKIDEVIDGVPANQRIRTDSQVILGSVGLLGDKVIDIKPGTIENGQPVSNNGEIQGAPEPSIKELVTGANDILGNFTLLSNQVKQIAEDINQGKGTVGLLIKDEALYKNLNNTVVDAQSLVKRIREGDGTVGKLLNDPKLYDQIQSTTNRMELLIADISNGRGSIGKLATDDELYNHANRIMSKLDEIAVKLDQTADKIERGEGTVGRLISDDKLYRETEATLTNLNQMSARLERGEGSAGKLLQDPELYNNLNSASSEVVKLLYDFRQDPKKYLTIKVKIF